jgi:hypothetical protein
MTFSTNTTSTDQPAGIWVPERECKVSFSALGRPEVAKMILILGICPGLIR